MRSPRTAHVGLSLSLLATPALGAGEEDVLAQQGHALRGHELALNLGAFGVGDENSFQVGLEWRFPRAKWDLRPMAGWFHAEGGANYWYAGLRYDWEFSERWALAPSFGVGIFQAGEIDLGGPVEFRSGIDVTYSFSARARASLGFYHLSNADLYETNGGANTLLFSLATTL